LPWRNAECFLKIFFECSKASAGEISESVQVFIETKILVHKGFQIYFVRLNILAYFPSSEEKTPSPQPLLLECLFIPRRMQNTITEILPFEIRYHKGANIGFDVTKGSFCLALKAAEKRRDNFLLEICYPAELNCYNTSSSRFNHLS
jgi:hypothetical protein